MKILICNLKYLLLLTVITALEACSHQQSADAVGDPPPAPKTLVDTTSVAVRDIQQERRFPATTFYPESNKLAAPISGYILQSPREAGERVNSGQVLFTLETKEHHAINTDPALRKSSLAELGVINVKAPSDGQIITLDQRQGDYVSEGSSLCTIARNDKTGFRLSVPFEYSNFVNIGARCTIELPDKSRLPARVTENLSTTNATSQTLAFLVKPLKPLMLPEGLAVMVIFQTRSAGQAAILPRSAILANETMDEFWVMQLVNDSTAVKVPVALGMASGDSVQVVRPAFPPSALILTEGNYGLEDTALVKIKSQVE
ncbi:MAG: HlyD family efflux transporter periplasmic adaptor subunit [Lewinellaceae bacterium]|nr:HlyD family efflux transporter periplasmic adaptor subunit [Lewinellaceae bacterium]